MTVDIGGLIEAQESLMADACTITNNPNGSADDVLNTTTLELVPPSAVAVYSGWCLIARDRRLRADTATPAEAADFPSTFVLKLPLTQLTVEPKPGDLVTCTGSVHDPGLISKVFRIVEIERDGYATSRMCRMRTTWASA